MMRKTLLLCLIHGFKGGDDTFGGFPEHLRALVSHALPALNIAVVVYPKFETRGDLKTCVERFRDWLQNKVIDLEVEAETPSPTIDPSVRVVLIGHSMGGIVSAEAFLAISSDTPLSPQSSPSVSSTLDSPTSSFLFPYIQAILSFDTPYLGIAPGVVAHGAEGHYSTASSTFTQLSGLAGGLWGAKTATTAEEKQQQRSKPPQGITAALPEAPNGAPATGALAASSSPKDAAGAAGDAAATPAWQRWGKVAMFTGAAGAVAAGGVAAYLKREEIAQGWGWVGSHLEFVGCLARGEELKRRVEAVTRASRTRGLGFANMYTVLGARGKVGVVGGIVAGDQRTFCNIPKSEAKKYWTPTGNDKAEDEIAAHMGMFYPKENPGYYEMSSKAASLIVDWTSDDWCDSPTKSSKQITYEDMEI